MSQQQVDLVRSAVTLEQTPFDRTMRPNGAASAMRAWLKGEAWKWSRE